ncbi:MAG: hypothetical protein M1821_009733 [Bathelium mastoideum]|nr:MAG: hypothetical protein M1821_009733 [Bathelium mastoideum]
MSTFNLPPQLIFKGNGGAHPPHGNITATDHGPVVVAFSWIFYSLTGMTVLVRLISRRNFAPDYWCVLAGFILLTLDSVTIHLAAHKGLGRHIATLSTGDLSQYNRAFYAGQILKVLILALSKISYLTIFTRLLLEASGRRKTIRIFCYSMIGVISAWAFATSMALALQCDTPHPWTFIGNKCVDQAVLYYLTGAFNIATDVVIVVIPAVIVLDIQLGRNKKAAVVAIFATRILVPPFAIVELALLPQYFDRADPTCDCHLVKKSSSALTDFV